MGRAIDKAPIYKLTILGRQVISIPQKNASGQFNCPLAFDYGSTLTIPPAKFIFSVHVLPIVYCWNSETESGV
jgi:hypothetical protein